MSIQQAHLTSGDKIGKYQIIEPLGAGGAAVVYRAEDLESGEIRAIKVLGHSALDDENLQRRFIREIAVLQKVSHENLVQIYEAGLHEDALFYVMEVVDSGTLKDILSEPLPWRNVAECGLQLVAALAVLQKNKIVHRDFKPGNIYLSSSGHIKLGDFGLVRDLQSSRLTADGMTMGTVLYMSPEQIRGEDQITCSADLYALGCVFYEMLTGEPPFNAELAMQVLDFHLKTPAPDPRGRAADCPEDFSILIRLMMSKRRQDRPRGALAVAEVLQKILAKETVDFVSVCPTFDSQLFANTFAKGQAAQEAGSTKPVRPNYSENPNLVDLIKQRPPLRTTNVSLAKLVIILVGLAAVIGLVMMF